MTKQVLLTIAGLQYMDEEFHEPVEIVTAGDYYYRNGKHFIRYDEAVEGSTEHISNTIKVCGDSMEVTKKGLANVHMVFEKNKKNMTCYATPFGSMTIGILASDVNVKESEENIDIQVQYSLEVNYEHFADCSIQMNIKSKDAGDFSLQ
jgi:uncharacterized beta-barrel protein YwiB (DUF1934 family)